MCRLIRAANITVAKFVAAVKDAVVTIIGNADSPPQKYTVTQS